MRSLINNNGRRTEPSSQYVIGSEEIFFLDEEMMRVTSDGRPITHPSRHLLEGAHFNRYNSTSAAHIDFSAPSTSNVNNLNLSNSMAANQRGDGNRNDAPLRLTEHDSNMTQNSNAAPPLRCAPTRSSIANTSPNSSQSSSDLTHAAVEPEDDALEFMVSVPDTGDNKGFSFLKLWAFTGPGFLMSIAYLDPGNIESDLQSGAVARYKLLWVLLASHVLGFLLQRLSSRLGVVSGRHLAEMAYEYYPRVPRLALWIMIEVAIIVSDMQEVIGTAIAFYLLSNKGIPLYAGVLITMLDTFTFLLIDRYGFRKLEVIFAVLIATMAITFGYEFVIVKPDALAMLEGMFVPWCSECGQNEFLQAISVVGAVIMPHNLYLHSALVKSRRINRYEKQAVTEANFYYFIESGVALICSFFINVFVVSVFAHGLYGKRNIDVYEMCKNSPGDLPQVFSNDTNPVESDIYKGGIFLGCAFGLPAMYIWGVGVMAAGQSSTMTGTYAGQFVMEGFLQMRWPRWLRVFVTRTIAIIPTLTVALMAQDVANLTGMNDFLNRVQMIQLPFALLPVITFTSHSKIMYEYKSTRTFQIFAFLVSVLVICINLFYVFDGVFKQNWLFLLALFTGMFIYMAFVLYLIYVCLQAMGLLFNVGEDGESCTGVPFLRRSDNWLTVRPLWHRNCQSVATTAAANSVAKHPPPNLANAERSPPDGDDALVNNSDDGLENAGFANSTSSLHQRRN